MPIKPYKILWLASLLLISSCGLPATVKHFDRMTNCWITNVRSTDGSMVVECLDTQGQTFMPSAQQVEALSCFPNVELLKHEKICRE